MGYAALGVAGFMLLGILMNLGRGFGFAAIALATAFCVVLPAAVGVRLLRPGADRRKLEQAERAWDGEFLRLAARRGGSLTVAEVMAHLDLGQEEAERRLDRFCATGLAEHRVSDEGIIVYRFQRMLGEAEKQRAVGVLDD